MIKYSDVTFLNLKSTLFSSTYTASKTILKGIGAVSMIFTMVVVSCKRKDMG